MRLLIISHMPHYMRPDGTVVGWGPTVQEIDQLATRFERVRHIACLHPGSPPASFLPYATSNVELIPVKPTGGDRLHDKLGVLMESPRYVRVMLRELARADVVHLRCPANVPMIAALLLPFIRKPKARWIKYAGSWRPDRFDSVPFAFQRWFLQTRFHRGRVTVNGAWPGQPRHMTSFYNPCLRDEELTAAREATTAKSLGSPLVLLFVGRLESAKGAGEALEVLARVRARGYEAVLEMAGDGPERPVYEERAAQLGVSDYVRFHGWLPRTVLPALYARAHLFVFPTRSEGWPKVLSEGMAYGVVPIASAVGAIPQYLSEFGVGRVLTGSDPADFADAVVDYASHPARWSTESERARVAAEAFTYSRYLGAVDRMLAEILET